MTSAEQRDKALFLMIAAMVALGCDVDSATDQDAGIAGMGGEFVADAGLGGMGGTGGLGGSYLTGIEIMQQTTAGDTVGIFRSYENEWLLTVGDCVAPMTSTEMKRHGINISDAQGASW